MSERAPLPLPRGIQHLGITVPDLDAATRFLQDGLGARIAYDGLTAADEPRQGAEVERQLGLPPGARIVRQRMFAVGDGPGLEVFQIEGDQCPASGLADLGLNHMSLYCDDIDGCLQRLRAAGGEPLSEVHGNSRHEDTPGNGSVYVRAPWGMLIELQTIPGGHYYPPDSEAEVWMPSPRDAADAPAQAADSDAAGKPR
ncbi:VOC family protein [Brevibacterium sp. 5221]|uniref:VOC family protein n=1 Tax=Brevibacterium rongguiense TaxID=2695267 RepID=A0A6N9H6J6_9MICO|nr:VOC family protein [Brevibacterium rongguiense]MYM19573.1 VOC family protein [Brevibacterium rongguiense]